ncbi:hypothetical protein E4U09_004046 [Claviceps aff. purpurea]|uniref:Uncharacterized protein n=1 Tax=Claviceps aff. purpurea TaxID=1967640 RepID=A0A9P7QFJ8_9HYPO|nr:hypothetical protein E4U09_004046 [Claviceps aff. purpurea]
MGRPRKRRAATEPPAPDIGTIASQSPRPSHGGSTVPWNSAEETAFVRDLDLLPQVDESLNYLGVLPDNFGDIASPALYTFPQHPYPSDIFASDNDNLGDCCFPLDFLSNGTGAAGTGIELLQGIDFNEPELSASFISKDISDSLQQCVSTHVHPPEPSEETPPSVLSTVPGTTPAIQQPRNFTHVSCGCLSSLYLAIESLNHLPYDVPSAMRATRSATKVAQDVLDCPYCSNWLLRDPLQPPPVQALQNMMYLGALVPSACNAYATILEMIDSETDSAIESKRQILFSFKDIGGLWGHVLDGQGSCSALKTYDNKALEPAVWQATVRSILKLDVYGLGGKTGESPTGRHLQRGLKDVVNHLDRTARVRHEMMDQLVKAGRVPRQSKYLVRHCAPIPEDQRDCVRLVESARMALDSLVLEQ